MLTLQQPFGEVDVSDALTNFCQILAMKFTTVRIIDGWREPKASSNTVLLQLFQELLDTDKLTLIPQNKITDTLQIECSLPKIRPIPYEFIGNSHIKTVRIISSIQLGANAMIQFMSSAVETLSSENLHLNFHLRRLVFTLNGADIQWRSNVICEFDRVLDRNQKLFKRRQHTATLLLGLAKFKKKSHGLNRDVINLMARFVNQTELAEVFKLQPQDKTKKRRCW